MLDDPQSFAARLDRAAHAVGATRPTSAILADLLARYAEPQRHYHTLAHVAACLELLDRFAALAEHPPEVELALWFHDAIYEPTRNDNEERSARLAEEALGGLEVPQSCRARIVRAIEATRRHDATEGDAALVVDLDLAILAAEPEVFARFEAQIRAEYAQVPEPLFRAGRRHVLEGFLARSLIYRHAPLRAAFEDAARANLTRRIGELSAG